LTKDYVSVTKFDGKEILKIEPEALTLLASVAIRDVSFLLRTAHLEKVAAILKDPQASDNDRYVALAMLRNADYVVERHPAVLPRTRAQRLFLPRKASRFGPA